MSNLSKKSPLSKLTRLEVKQKIPKAMAAEPEQLFLHLVKKYYTKAVYYRTYRLSSCAPKYDGSASSHISKMVKKVISKMGAHFFDAKGLIPIIGYIATLKSACNNNNIHEGAAKWFSHSNLWRHKQMR